MKWFVVLLIMTSPDARVADLRIIERPVFTSQEACDDARPSVEALWRWKEGPNARIVSSFCAPYGRPNAS